jgi:hypothetical protein
MKPQATTILPKAMLAAEIVTAQLAGLARKLARVRTLSSKLEELLDDTVHDLDDLVESVSRSNLSTPGSGQVLRHLRVTRRTGQFPKDPVQGVVVVNIVPHADGSATAQFDGRPALVLPPLVAATLEILKANFDSGKDHLVGWKSVEHIQSALKERTGRQPSRAAVKELVFRLRRLLRSHGENPGLVQHNRNLGYRFAVWRAPGAVNDRDDQ